MTPKTSQVLFQLINALDSINEQIVDIKRFAKQQVELIAKAEQQKEEDKSAQ